MQRKSIRLLLLTSCILIIQWACQPTRDILPDSAKSDISIEQAKQQYKVWYGANARRSGQLSERKPIWSAAKLVELPDGRMGVETPLLYNWTNQISLTSGRFAEQMAARQDTRRKLLSYKARDGSVQACVISLIPASDYIPSGSTEDDFTGLLLVQNISEDSNLTAWQCVQGKAVTRVSVNGNSNGRIRQCDAVTYEKWKPIDAITYRAKTQPNNPNMLPLCRHDCGVEAYVNPSGEETYWERVSIDTYYLGDCSGGSPAPPSNLGYNPGENPYLGPTGGGQSPGQQVFIPQYQQGADFVASLSPTERFLYDYGRRGIVFDDEEQEIIYANPEIIPAIAYYIQHEGRRPDMSLLKIDPDWTSSEDLLVATHKLMNDNTERDRLPIKERELLGLGTNKYDENVKQYFNNARRATFLGFVYYGDYKAVKENGESKANAFKHALFIWYHANSFGRQTAEELANAHEEYVPARDKDDKLIRPTLQSLEAVDNNKKMDILNNYEALRLYDAAPPGTTTVEFANTIFDGVNSGLFYYVSGSLKKTNQ